MVFPQVELLDFAGPLEVLSIARFIDEGQCFTVGPVGRPITNPSDLAVTVDHLLSDAPEADVLIVPGGAGAHNEHPHTDAVVAYIRDAARRGALIASVCTGTFLLGRAGVLDGRHCTTHKRYRERLAKEFPRAVVEAATVVADGADLVTAANVSSGIDLAVYLVERFFGPDRAARIADNMNFATRQDQILEFGAAPAPTRTPSTARP